jgi:hypothetical protein
MPMFRALAGPDLVAIERDLIQHHSLLSCMVIILLGSMVMLLQSTEPRCDQRRSITLRVCHYNEYSQLACGRNSSWAAAEHLPLPEVLAERNGTVRDSSILYDMLTVASELIEVLREVRRLLRLDSVISTHYSRSWVTICSSTIFATEHEARRS